MSFHTSKIVLNDYETFLIVKSFQKCEVEEHIGFIRLKEGEK
jgi:hypothetical protein